MEDLLASLQIWHQTLITVQNEIKLHYPNYPKDLPDEEFYPNLTLMLGVKKVGAKVEWAEESIQLLKNRM